MVRPPRREHAAPGRARGVVTISKNSNVATGAEGERNAHEVLDVVASTLGVEASDLLIGSTGVIGRQYPMDTVRSFLSTLPNATFDASLRSRDERWASVTSMTSTPSPHQRASYAPTRSTCPRTTIR